MQYLSIFYRLATRESFTKKRNTKYLMTKTRNDRANISTDKTTPFLLISLAVSFRACTYE